MNKHLSIHPACALIFLFATLVSPAGLAQEISVVTIQDVIDSVKAEIKYAQGVDDGPALIKIETVEITLAIKASIEGSGAAKGKIPVLGIGAELGGSIAREQSSTFTIVFSPDEEVLVGDDPSEHPLGDMILAVKQATIHATQDPPEFALKKAVIEFGFNVEKKVKGGVTFLFVQIGGSGSKRSLHSVKITLTSAG